MVDVWLGLLVTSLSAEDMTMLMQRRVTSLVFWVVVAAGDCLVCLCSISCVSVELLVGASDWTLVEIN